MSGKQWCTNAGCANSVCACFGVLRADLHSCLALNHLVNGALAAALSHTL